MIERLAEQGATWVQFDEPCFVEDRTEKELDALRLAYEELGKVHERPRILVKTYFDHVGDAYGVLRDLPIEGVGLDFTGFVHGDPLGPDVHEHGGRHNAEFIANQDGARRPVALRRDRRRPERLDQSPRALARRAGGLCRPGPPSSSSRRAARCSTRRSTSTPSRLAATPTSTTRCAPGWPSPSRRSARSRPWPRAWPRGARRSPTSSMQTTGRGIPGASPLGPATPRFARGSRPSTRSMISARAPSRSAGRRSAPASTSRSSSPSTTIGSYPADGRDPPDPR